MQTTANRCKAWQPEREHHEAKCEALSKQTCPGLARPCEKQNDSWQHCEYGPLKTETTEIARPNLQTASELQQPSCSTPDCQEHHECHCVTKNIRMQAALVHAVQPVHEAQDLRPPNLLPRGLCQLSKDHMREDARSELQKLPDCLFP